MAGKVKPDEILNKLVVTKEGKKLGTIKDLIFETRTGEIVQMVITNPTSYALNLNLEQTKNKELLISWSSVMAISDFVVVDEQDLI
ncbi:MAG: PRC-barrel domain-containing protein [Candidatus Pacearchaeota archaeon]